MEEVISYFRNKKNLAALLSLAIMVLAIPLGTELARRQQLLRSQAAGGSVVITGSGVEEASGSGKIARTAKVDLLLVSPFGAPASPAPVVTPSPAPTVTSVPSPSASASPRASASASPTAAASASPSASASASPAAELSTISGRVVGTDGTGLANTRLDTCNNSINPRTDGQGNFSFQLNRYAGFCVKVNGLNNYAVRAVNDKGLGSEYNHQIAGRGPISIDNSDQLAQDRTEDNGFDFVLYPITIAGSVKNSVNNTPLANIAVRIIKSDGAAREVSTGSDGKFNVANFVQRDEQYAVRVTGNTLSPQTAPAGYQPPAKTSTSGWVFDEQSSVDTPLNSQSYENQKAGSHHDCAGPGNSVRVESITAFISNISNTLGRCSFVYDPSPTTSNYLNSTLAFLQSFLSQSFSNLIKPVYAACGSAGNALACGSKGERCCTRAEIDAGGAINPCADGCSCISNSCVDPPPPPPPPPTGTLAVSPNNGGSGSSVIVSWTITPAASTDWIGFYTPTAGNTAYIDWFYVSCSRTASAARASSSCSFSIPASAAVGNYEFRLFSNNSSTTALATARFTTIAASPSPSLSPTPRPSSSPIASASASPSASPSSSPVSLPGTWKIIISEDPSFRNDVRELNASELEIRSTNADGSVVYALKNYEFTDKRRGQKRIFAKFIAASREESQRSSDSVNFIPEPKIENLSCNLDVNGTFVDFRIQGENFNDEPGQLYINNGLLEADDISNWGDGLIRARVSAPADSRFAGQAFNFIIARSDGREIKETCRVGTSTLSLGAKLFCRAPSQHGEAGVDLVLVDLETGQKVKQPVVINQDGVIEGLNYSLQEGHRYKLSIKSPKSLRKVAEFTAGAGTTVIGEVVGGETKPLSLPIGDIFPRDGGDGKINSADKGELNRQWGTGGANKSGDFNQDGTINSFDWACMRYDFNKESDVEPAGVAVPRQSPAASASPQANN